MAWEAGKPPERGSAIDPGLAFGLVWAGFLAYLGVLLAAPRLGRRPVWALIGLAVLGFALAPVLLSQDAYSYLAYARLGVLHGLDPYVHAPDAVPTDPVFADVAWTEATSVYGPLFTLGSYPLAWLGVGGGIAALKAVAALSVLALTALVARLAAWRGADPVRAAAFVGLNPLVLVHVVGGAHNDGLAMLLALAAVGCLLACRPFGAGAALVGAVAIKASSLFLAPYALLAALRGVPSEAARRAGNPGAGASSTGAFAVPAATGPEPRTRRPGLAFAAGALAAALAISAAAWVAFGWDWTSAIGLAGENQDRTSHMSIPITASRLLGLDPDPVRAVAVGLLAALNAGLLVWVWRGGDWVRAAGWAALGLLLATAWLLPWYLVWALPLAAIGRDRPLALATLALTAYQLGARIPL